MHRFLASANPAHTILTWTQVLLKDPSDQAPTSASDKPFRIERLACQSPDRHISLTASDSILRCRPACGAVSHPAHPADSTNTAPGRHSHGISPPGTATAGIRCPTAAKIAAGPDSMHWPAK